VYVIVYRRYYNIIIPAFGPDPQFDDVRICKDVFLHRKTPWKYSLGSLLIRLKSSPKVWIYRFGRSRLQKQVFPASAFFRLINHGTQMINNNAKMYCQELLQPSTYNNVLERRGGLPEKHDRKTIMYLHNTLLLLL